MSLLKLEVALSVTWSRKPYSGYHDSFFIVRGGGSDGALLLLISNKKRK
jgi:hypothetical protein